jgi:hypothetical protein
VGSRFEAREQGEDGGLLRSVLGQEFCWFAGMGMQVYDIADALVVEVDAKL